MLHPGSGEASVNVTQCCAQVICHGIPDSRELQAGDVVNVDVTAYLGGCVVGLVVNGMGMGCTLGYQGYEAPWHLELPALVAVCVCG